MTSKMPLPVYTSLRQLLLRYDRRSIAAILILLAVQSIVGTAFGEHVEAHPWMWRDQLLIGTWLLMFALLAWDIRPGRDLPLAGVALIGGLVIEWWGTTTSLWTYFTVERPPIWILPAWPTAALAIDRIGRMLTVVKPVQQHARPLYWIVLPAFMAWMTLFLWPSIDIRSSQVVMVLMATTILWKPLPHRDICLFLGGAALGVLLEYWGTSRECWTYYTEQTPPPVAVVAHGFAAVAFSRGVQILEDTHQTIQNARGETVTNHNKP